MITLLVPILALLAADPSPAPAASSAPTPLREIGRIRSVSACTSIVVHANSAISSALANDADLGIAINRLRTTDIEDDNDVRRRNKVNDLYALASRIRTASSSGDLEVKRLRDLAAESTDPARKSELKAFADALGGALYRQKRAAVDLDKGITIIEGRRESVAARSLSDDSRTSLLHVGRNPIDRPMPISSPSGEYNRMLRDIADDFDARTSLILIDEGTAADLAVGATTGC